MDRPPQTQENPELLRIQQQIDRVFRLIVISGLLACTLILLAMLS